MIATSKDPKLLSILISFLGPQPNPNTQEIAFEGVERVAPFLSLWGDKQLQATAAVKAGLSTFLATSPPHLQAERAERLLLGLSR
jgi:hypothetical protein